MDWDTQRISCWKYRCSCSGWVRGSMGKWQPSFVHLTSNTLIPIRGDGCAWIGCKLKLMSHIRTYDNFTNNVLFMSSLWTIYFAEVDKTCWQFLLLTPYASMYRSWMKLSFTAHSVFYKDTLHSYKPILCVHFVCVWLASRDVGEVRPLLDHAWSVLLYFLLFVNLDTRIW